MYKGFDYFVKIQMLFDTLLRARCNRDHNWSKIDGDGLLSLYTKTRIHDVHVEYVNRHSMNAAVKIKTQ